MIPKKIIVLLENKDNENLIDYVIPYIKQHSSEVYFICILEIPYKYSIDFEIGSQINLGENILKDAGHYLQSQKINYDLNSDKFILLQSRNSGVGVIKESKRLDVDLILYTRSKKDNSYKYDYINKHSEVDTIQILKV